MSVDCEGRHQCDPEPEATDLGLTWDCPNCGRAWRSFCLADADETTKRVLTENGYNVSAMHGWRA